MQPAELETLKRSPLFVGLSDDEFKMVVHYLQPFTMSFKKDQSIYLLNDGNERIGMLLTGKASEYYESATGDRMLTFSAGPGEFLGGADLCPDKVQSFSRTATANSACVIAFIPSTFFTEIIQSGPGDSARQKVLKNLFSILISKCAYLYQRVLFISMKSIRQKICSYLIMQHAPQRNPTIVLPMNRKELAKYLNITRPSLSRELSFLQKKQIIRFSKNTFQILDMQQLQQYAEGLLL